MQMRSAVSGESLSSVQSRGFCLLRSVLGLVTRPLVNIKRGGEEPTSLAKTQISFYSILS
jgi:hypothetical protein